MNQHKYDLNEALNWIGRYHDRLANEFLEKSKHIPSFKEGIDEQVRSYVDGLGNWVRANEEWSFEVSSLPYLLA